MTFVSLDYETYSPVDLRDSGVYPYVACSDTGIWCLCYSWENEDEVFTWTPDQPFPERLAEHIRSGGELRAHNSNFERLVSRDITEKRYGMPSPRLDQWFDSAAEAASMQLPRSLEGLSAALGLPVQKDKEGHALMLRLCRPRKTNEDGSYVWWNVPEKLERLYAYCRNDVAVEKSASKYLRRLDPPEREIWLLDARINDRGFHFDRDLVLAAQEIASEGTRRANSHLEEITGGAVATVTNSGNLRKWLAEQGIETDSVDKKHVSEMMDDPTLPEKVRFALQVRVDGARSSVAKLKSMLEYAGNTERLCGMLMYHGAGTGRWSGKGPQIQNFPRGTVTAPESYIPFVMENRYDEIGMTGEHPLAVVTSLLRACLNAEPGCDLIAGDYSAIEARVLAVLAGQQDEVELFFRGEDVYKYMAAKLFKVPVAEVTKFQRQTGKFAVLGCGYGMGAAKAITAGNGPAYGLSLDEDSAKAIVDAYRMTHPAVVQFWKDTNDALVEATKTPGVPIDFGANGILRAFVTGNYLYVRLPSKRVLCYPAPSVVLSEMPWSTDDKPAWRDALQFYGVDSFNRQWGPIRTYGGMAVENIVQAVARDFLAESMLRLEAAGYPVVASVHDEIVVEVPEGFGTETEFKALMTNGADWTRAFPMSVESYRAKRFKK